MSIEQEAGGEKIRNPQPSLQSNSDRFTTTMVFSIVAALLFIFSLSFATKESFGGQQGFPNVFAGLSSMGFAIGGGLALIAAALAKDNSRN